MDEFVRVLGGEGEVHAHDCRCVRCIDINAPTNVSVSLPAAA